MLRNAAILAEFRGLVGFRKAPDTFAWTKYTSTPDYSYLYKSASGFYFDDDIELIRMENLNDVKREEEPLEQFMDKIYNQGVNDVILDFYKLRIQSSYAKTLMASQPFMNGAGQMGNLITKQGRFVGHKIEIKASSYISVLLKRIGLQFTDPQPALNLYIYSPYSQTPIHTITVNYNVSNSVLWIDLKDNSNDIYLNREQSSEYYIGYFEDDITGNAIYRNYTGKPCNCSATITKLNNYVSSYPVSVSSSNLNGTNLFDTERLNYDQYNFGINIEPYVYCDVSNLIIQHKIFFAQAIQKRVQLKALEKIYTTPETTNFSLGSARKDAFMLAEKITPEYKETLEAISMEFSGLDQECLPPKRNTIGIGYLRR